MTQILVTAYSPPNRTKQLIITRGFKYAKLYCNPKHFHVPETKTFPALVTQNSSRPFSSPYGCVCGGVAFTKASSPLGPLCLWQCCSPGYCALLEEIHAPHYDGGPATLCYKSAGKLLSQGLVNAEGGNLVLQVAGVKAF